MCLAVGVEHPAHLRLTGPQHEDWRDYWHLEPWGEIRDDLRTWVQHIRWIQARVGSNREPPKPLYPYIQGEEQLDPQAVIEGTAAFAEAIEPRPDGKGYQYTEAAKQRLKEAGLWDDGNDNRQT